MTKSSSSSPSPSTNHQGNTKAKAKAKATKLTKRGKQRNNGKPKMTKEERRVKYTNLARERRHKQISKKRHVNTICYRCRQRGHSVNDCPNANNSSSSSNSDGGTCTLVEPASTSTSTNIVSPSLKVSTCKCYKCGSNDHSLKQCPELSQDEQETVQRGKKLNYTAMTLPFATCFICHEVGHLSSQCKLNTHGIYVNGNANGSNNAAGVGCKFCGMNDHLFIHCPQQQKQTLEKGNDDHDDDDDDDNGVNVDAFLEDENDTNDIINSTTRSKESAKVINRKKKRKVVQF